LGAAGAEPENIAIFDKIYIASGTRRAEGVGGHATEDYDGREVITVLIDSTQRTAEVVRVSTSK
jgi:hypothetical protein